MNFFNVKKILLLMKYSKKIIKKSNFFLNNLILYKLYDFKINDIITLFIVKKAAYKQGALIIKLKNFFYFLTRQDRIYLK